MVCIYLERVSVCVCDCAAGERAHTVNGLGRARPAGAPRADIVRTDELRAEIDSVSTRLHRLKGPQSLVNRLQNHSSALQAEIERRDNAAQ